MTSHTNEAAVLEPTAAFELAPVPATAPQPHSGVPSFPEPPPAPTPVAAPPAVPQPEQKAKSKTKRASSKITASSASRVIERYKQLAGAPESERALLASALGCSADPEPLTIAVLTATKNSLEGVLALREIAAASTFQSTIVVLALEKPVARRVWRLLHSLGALDSPTLPSRDVTYAPLIAEAAATLSGDHLAVLEGIQEYLGL